MSEDDSIIQELRAARQRFLELVAAIRPDLHRYCARMMGSVIDGEDIVQDALAQAYYELSELKELPAMRSWLFRIAHNRALDQLRRLDRRMSDPLDGLDDELEDTAALPDATVAREQAVHAAVSRFLELTPAQRSCVILKDVLEHSLEEIAMLLGFSVAAVKSSLHRGRIRLRELSPQTDSDVTHPRHVSPTLAHYAALFNARDWNAVRALLVDDVKLDVVSVVKRGGRDNVDVYFTRYAGLESWSVQPGWLDGREVLAVFRKPERPRPDYFILLAVHDARITAIRDFIHVPYIGQDARFVPAEHRRQ